MSARTRRFTVLAVVPADSDRPLVAAVIEGEYTPIDRHDASDHDRHMLVVDAPDAEHAELFFHVVYKHDGEMREVTASELTDGDVLVFTDREDRGGGLPVAVVDSVDHDRDNGDVAVCFADDPDVEPAVFDGSALLWVAR